MSQNENLIFHQLFEATTSTYTYLLADKISREAIIIDPVLETADRDLKLIDELGLKLKYIFDTHVHADHITGAGSLRDKTKAKTCVSHIADVECVDVHLEDGQTLGFGSLTIKAIATPGHTDACMSFVINDMVFTGDALLIRGTGRTDFQQGSSEKLYHSITQKIFPLGDHMRIFPGHDYRGLSQSSVAEEKKYNPRIAGKSEQEFVHIMSELKLANPKKIHEAVPANLRCGKKQDGKTFHPQLVDGTPEITTQDLNSKLNQLTENVLLIDVRTPEEYHSGEYSHIAGAQLVTLGPQLIAFLTDGDRNKEIVFICRSGARSGTATRQSMELGYQKTMNMQGGMIDWTRKGFPVADSV